MSQNANDYQSGPGPDHPRRGVGEHQCRHQDGDHAAAIERVGEQERGERREQAERGLLLGCVESRSGQGHHPADQQTGDDAAEVGDDEPDGQVDRTDGRAAHGDARPRRRTGPAPSHR